MYTTINEDGVLNNYATEPQIYYAEYPSTEEQRRYSFQAGVATLLLSALVLLAFGVS
ncbi:ssl1498 family light-harvesting-like protein [Tolypothrix sp. FACHB-123]|uniref:photosystem II assembly protein Psb34 n=1 Tax=Tolypothrix sp. FACHB-123 TaxID=2692868 RepID=UPI001689E912|nr:ssl1498 family light-harvesting-like protein [Tolypothrix sp. FACHB-123]MBD2354404.1 ssl1498 family light-harvesting-like protein [Tolypothrix sp. FACHB-123]